MTAQLSAAWLALPELFRGFVILAAALVLLGVGTLVAETLRFRRRRRAAVEDLLHQTKRPRGATRPSRYYAGPSRRG